LPSASVEILYVTAKANFDSLVKLIILASTFTITMIFLVFLVEQRANWE
jgi:hypothetical protein